MSWCGPIFRIKGLAGVLGTDFDFLGIIEIMRPDKAALISWQSRLASPFTTLVALFVVFGASLPSRVDAYVLEGPKWPNGSTVVMQLSLGSGSVTLSDGSTSWNNAVFPALGSWNGVMGSTQLGSVMNSTAAVSSGDHVNSMAFASSNFGQSFGSNTLAVTTYWMSGSTMTEGDILFNSAQAWDSYRGALRSAYDIRRVALHELGHVLGLGHSDLSSAIMYAYITNTDALTADDIARRAIIICRPFGNTNTHSDSGAHTHSDAGTHADANSDPNTNRNVNANTGRGSNDRPGSWINLCLFERHVFLDRWQRYLFPSRRQRCEWR